MSPIGIAALCVFVGFVCFVAGAIVCIRDVDL